MKLEFKNVINKYKDKTAIVIGLGPSLASHIDKIQQLPRNGDFVLIGCNDIDVHTSISPNYWVWANSEDNIKRTHKRLNSKKHTTVVYADSVDLTPRSAVDKLLTVDYLPYDQRHFEGNRCGGEICCKHIVPGRLTIQEELKKFTNYNKYPTISGTVAVQMLPLAILLGCKNIYITGVDLDYSKGYVGGRNAHRAKSFHEGGDSFTKNMPTILDTMTIINDSAKNIGVNIYCLDDGLPLSSVFEHSAFPVP